MYILQIDFGTPEFDDALRLRYEVLRRPLGLEYSPEQIALEYDNIHLAAYSDAGHILGYLNLTPYKDKIVKMRQVAVAPDYQGRGIGKAVAEQLASLGAALVLTARSQAQIASCYLRPELLTG